MPINPTRINFEVHGNFAQPQSFMRIVTTLRLLDVEREMYRTVWSNSEKNKRRGGKRRKESRKKEEKEEKVDTENWREN